MIDNMPETYKLIYSILINKAYSLTDKQLNIEKVLADILKKEVNSLFETKSKFANSSVGLQE